MRSHAGVATKVFDRLAQENINIQMISTSEIKISVVIAERYVELAVRALHDAFALESRAELSISLVLDLRTIVQERSKNQPKLVGSQT